MLRPLTPNIRPVLHIDYLAAQSELYIIDVSWLAANPMVLGHSSSTMLTLFGGRVEDLRTFLVEERLPVGWEPKIRTLYGLTIGTFNKTVLQVELGIKEPKPNVEAFNQPATGTEAAAPASST